MTAFNLLQSITGSWVHCHPRRNGDFVNKEEIGVSNVSTSHGAASLAHIWTHHKARGASHFSGSLWAENPEERSPEKKHLRDRNMATLHSITESVALPWLTWHDSWLDHCGFWFKIKSDFHWRTEIWLAPSRTGVLRSCKCTVWHTLSGMAFFYCFPPFSRRNYFTVSKCDC